MSIKETTFKLTELAIGLNNVGEYTESIVILQSIDRLCDSNSLDMPEEAIMLNISLDHRMGLDVLSLKHVAGYNRN